MSLDLMRRNPEQAKAFMGQAKRLGAVPPDSPPTLPRRRSQQRGKFRSGSLSSSSVSSRSEPEFDIELALAEVAMQRFARSRAVAEAIAR